MASVGSTFVGPKSKVEIPATVLAKPALMSWADWLTKLCQAQEWIRLHHNVKAGNVTKAARDYRAVDLDVQSYILIPAILAARPQVTKESGWIPTPGDIDDSMDPAIVKAKGDGRADPLKPADMTTLLKFDIGSLRGDSPEPVDPLENFTIYTELDVGGYVTVAANLLTIANLPRTEDVRVYKDMGAAHFGATFEHLVDSKMTAGDAGGLGVFWAVSNSIDDLLAWIGANAEAVCAYWYVAATELYLYSTEPGGGSTDSGAAFPLGTQFYFTAERTDETTQQLRGYDDAPRASLVDTLSVTLVNGRRLQHVFGANSYNDGAAFNISYTVANLDLQEAAAGAASLLVNGGLINRGLVNGGLVA